MPHVPHGTSTAGVIPQANPMATVSCAERLAHQNDGNVRAFNKLLELIFHVGKHSICPIPPISRAGSVECSQPDPSPHLS